MALEDVKEKIQTELKNQWEQFQETSLYIQTKERFENLSPVMQKLSLIGVSILFLYLFFFLILFLIIKLNATLYDGWRQLYFLHLIIVYFCIYGLNFLFLFFKKKIKYIYFLLFSYLSFML